MDCSACGTSNDPGRKFCLECGAPLARACPACGAANPAAGKFCGECGAALLTAEPPATADGTDDAQAPVVPTTERRLVSVLFLDLVSFTIVVRAARRRGDARPARRLLPHRAGP